MRDKKAQFELSKSIYWTVAGIIITIIILAFSIILAGYQNRLTNVPSDLKIEPLISRFTDNPDCFAYQEPQTKKVFTQVIDPVKFTEERLNNCYQVIELDKQKFDFQLELKRQQEQIKTKNYLNLKPVTIQKDILVKIDSQFQKDILVIKVQEND